MNETQSAIGTTNKDKGFEMGSIPTINAHRFPTQGEYLGRRVEVCFNYDAEAPLRGEIVRDDMEEPMRTIIKLDDGRYVLATECQYRPV